MEFQSLPLKQQTFILEYLGNGFNATKAAIAAGYAPGSADTQGSRLLVNAKVAAIIAGRTKKALTTREITAERVLDEIAKLAFLDPRDLFGPDGELIQIRHLGDGCAASIAGLEISEILQDGIPVGKLKKIKFSDKRASLELLGRYLKLFVDKVEHTGTVGVTLVHSVPRPKRDEKQIPFGNDNKK